MTEVTPAGNAGLMAGLLDKLNNGGAGRVRLYAGIRPATNAAPTGALVALVILADNAGEVSVSTGDLMLDIGVESTVLIGTAPTWARFSSGEDQALFDCDARLSSSPNTGQELVVAAPAGFYAGAMLRIQSGTFSARP